MAEYVPVCPPKGYKSASVIEKKCTYLAPIVPFNFVSVRISVWRKSELKGSQQLMKPLL